MSVQKHSEPFLTGKHRKDLESSGLTPEQVSIAGHFSVSKAQAQKLVGYKLPGLVFRYCDPDGNSYKRINGQPFYRIKPDWGNSSKNNEDDDDKPPKYLSPKGDGCRPYFSRLYPNWKQAIKSTKIDIWETEGEKKGDCGCANGLAVIAFGGVDSWVDHCDRKTGEDLDDSRELPELTVVCYYHRKVYQCYDSDIVEKLSVQSALAKRAYKLKVEKDAYPHLVLLPNELDGSKNGLDDFVVRHGKEALIILASAAKPTPFKGEEEGEGKEKRTIIVLDLKEPNIRYKALMAWSVLKETWAFRSGIGWYQWQKTHWSQVTEDEFNAVFTRFMDAQNWDNRSNGHIQSIRNELKSRLLIKEQLWNSPTKISFFNGTLDLATQQFTETHNSLDRLVQVRPYVFDQSAQCPTWLKFIHEAMEGDVERIHLVQAMFRYATLPRPRNRKAEVEKSFDLHGEKGTGKGTTLDVLTKLVGEENIAAISTTTFETPQGLAQMVDKLLAVDYDASGHLKNVGNFNRVVSNEPIEMKKLYRDMYTGRLGVVLVRAYNHHISVSEGSEGLDRRLTVIPFHHRPQTVDNDLSKKLEAELSGIFAWCYSLDSQEMRQRIMDAGNIQAIAQSSLERFEANNPEFRFLCECFPDGKDSIQAGSLYNHYVEWCQANGHKFKSTVKFSPAIKSLGCQRSPGKFNGKYFYTIPRMSDFDTAAHLGIVSRPLRDSWQDSSKPEITGDRDSCRPLEPKTLTNIEKAVINSEENHQEPIQQKLATQPSTTISKSHSDGVSTISDVSQTVSTVSMLKVGDRVGKREKLGWVGTIQEIHGNYAEVLWRCDKHPSSVDLRELEHFRVKDSRH